MIELVNPSDCRDAAALAAALWSEADTDGLEQEFETLVQSPEAALFVYRENERNVCFARKP